MQKVGRRVQGPLQLCVQRAAGDHPKPASKATTTQGRFKEPGAFTNVIALNPPNNQTMWLFYHLHLKDRQAEAQRYL